MSTTIQPTTDAVTDEPADDQATERLAFEDRSTEELLDELKELREIIQKCVDTAMRDGRPDVSETPIATQEAKYRANYEAVMDELIDRGAI